MKMYRYATLAAVLMAALATHPAPVKAQAEVKIGLIQPLTGAWARSGKMSQRGAEMLKEDMDALGPIKIKEVEGAQQQIIAVVRQLESDGTISLKGTVGEQYVV